jgi:hypothetical protein
MNSSMMKQGLLKTPFWYDDPSVLIAPGSFFEIFPSRKYDMTRKLNALVRLSLYYAVIMYVYQKDRKYLVLPLIVLGVTWLVYYKQEDSQKQQIYKQSVNNQLQDLVQLNDLQTECQVPTKDNPFMNPEIIDFGNDEPAKPKSCPSYNNVGVQRRVEDLFNEDLYRDVTDIFGKENSQRQYYTVPGSQIPNDQGGFAQWLYGTPKTCKEGNKVACLSANGHGGGGPGGPP